MDPADLAPATQGEAWRFPPFSAPAGGVDVDGGLGTGQTQAAAQVQDRDGLASPVQDPSRRSGPPGTLVSAFIATIGRTALLSTPSVPSSHLKVTTGAGPRAGAVWLDARRPRAARGSRQGGGLRQREPWKGRPNRGKHWANHRGTAPFWGERDGGAAATGQKTARPRRPDPAPPRTCVCPTSSSPEGWAPLLPVASHRSVARRTGTPAPSRSPQLPILILDLSSPGIDAPGQRPP